MRTKRALRAENLPPVIVRWLDASRNPGFDGSISEIPDGLVLNHTIGYLVSKTKKYVRLVQDVSPIENTVRWPYDIPASLVVGIDNLDLPKTTKQIPAVTESAHPPEGVSV